VDRLLGDRECITKTEITQFSVQAIRAKNVLNTIDIPLQEDLAAMFARSLTVVD